MSCLGMEIHFYTSGYEGEEEEFSGGTCVWVGGLEKEGVWRTCYTPISFTSVDPFPFESFP